MILLIAQPHTYSTRRIAIEARRLRLPVAVVPPAEILAHGFDVDPSQYALLYVRSPYVRTRPDAIPHIVQLAKRFREAGKPVIDARVAEGQLGLGKWRDYKILEQAGIPIPRTRKFQTDLPPSFEGGEDGIVLKWQFGMKARDVFLVRNERQLARLLPKHPLDEWLVQEFIPADYEYKVVTVGYKALPVVLRFKTGERGFRVKFEEVSGLASAEVGQVVRVAESAAKVLGRQTAKVDILEKSGRLYVLEVNRMPGLKSYEKLSGINAFGHILAYCRAVCQQQGVLV